MEYADVMRRNLACPSIDSVLVFDEGSRDLPRDTAKLLVRAFKGRPTYQDYFDWINEIASPGDISIIANADIFFDERVALFRYWTPPDGVVLALARWEQADDSGARLRDRNDSQDAWVFTGRVRQFNAGYPVGVVGCDNRFAMELSLAGYSVLNPSFSIRSYHLHSGERGEYEGEGRAGSVAPPYAYVWPHNLWSLPRTLLHNVVHPRARVGWRFDRRFWSSTLRTHWLRKAFGILRASSSQARRP